jgi:hypothetical protein
VNIPEFQRRDAGGGSGSDASVPTGVNATTTSGGVVLANEPLVRMTFSPEGLHFPSSLLVAGHELMAAPTVTCADERHAGISLYPAVRIDGATSSTLANGDVHVDLVGPGIAKVSLDWNTSFPCGAGAGVAAGRTTFTMFEDGRINRSDYVGIPNQPVSTECDCGGDDAWYVSSYFTFARDQLASVVGATATADTGTQVTGTACVTGDAFQLAMGWRTGHSTRARLPQGTVSAGTIAFVEDLTNPGATNTLPSGFQGAAQTTWWAGASSTCSDLRARVAPYQENSGQPLPTLMIASGSSAAQGYGVALDGIFGGETDQALPGRAFPDDVVTLTTTTPLAGFGLWIDVGAGKEIASVHKSPTDPTSSWYSVQTPSALPTHRVLWFPDGLTTTDSITISLQQ